MHDELSLERLSKKDRTHGFVPFLGDFTDNYISVMYHLLLKI